VTKDLRTGFLLGGQRVALVTTGDRSDDTLATYRVNSTTRQLSPAHQGHARVSML